MIYIKYIPIHLLGSTSLLVLDSVMVLSLRLCFSMAELGASFR